MTVQSSMISVDESKVSISVVVPVKNEVANLSLCLESLVAFDDVLVVDSDSSDGTREIASRYGCRVTNFQWNGKFPKKRNWVLRTQSFKYPWVLFLDADERVTPEFIAELQSVLSKTHHHGFWIGYQNWFLGRHLKYGDPMKKLALVKVGYGEYEEIREESWSSMDMEVHEHIVVDGSIGTIEAKLHHHDKRYLSAYYARQNDYSTWEAKRSRSLDNWSALNSRQKLKYRMLNWPIFPLIYFIATYILRAGFLDGWAGFYFAISKMFYFYQIQAKLREAAELNRSYTHTRIRCKSEVNGNIQ